MTTVALFISFFDNGNVKGNNLEIQVTQILQEITDLKERMDSLQKNIEWYISNNNGLTKLNSMVQGLAQERVYRINLQKKIKSMEKTNGKQIKNLWTKIGDINNGIENRLLAKANATEVSFGSKLDETVRTIEQKCRGSMSNLNQTLENLYEQITQWSVPKQVNGGWTAWGSWTNCSSTCGKGINNRVRTCTNPAPANGGSYCDGVGMEYNLCEISSCKVNGGWTAWGSWSNCNSTCGNGINNRVRTCSNPVPADGGNYCDGVGMEYNECQTSPCKACPANYSLYAESCGRFCYRYESSDCQTWTKARRACQAEGGDLLAPSECNYEFFSVRAEEEASRNEGCDRDFWLGARRTTERGDFRTVSGDHISNMANFWGRRQPDNKDGYQNCLVIAGNFDFMVNDDSCFLMVGYICQI